MKPARAGHRECRRCCNIAPADVDSGVTHGGLGNNTTGNYRDRLLPTVQEVEILTAAQFDGNDLKDRD